MMKTKKTKFLTMNSIMAALLIAMSVACSKNNPLSPVALGCADWAEQVSDELTAFNNAGVEYSKDPTEANCNSFKNAAENYYEALEGIRSCATTAGASQADIDAAIAEAKKEVGEVDCDG